MGSTMACLHAWRRNVIPISICVADMTPCRERFKMGMWPGLMQEYYVDGTLCGSCSSPFEDSEVWEIDVRSAFYLRPALSVRLLNVPRSNVY